VHPAGPGHRGGERNRSTLSGGPVGDPLAVPRLRAFLGKRAGSVSVAVEDLRSGQEWQWNPDGRYTTASIVKVDILEALLHRAAGAGGRLSARQVGLAEAMIEDSDNHAAQTLWDQLGGSAGIGAYNGLAGLSQTGLDAAGYWGDSVTSAGDQIDLLQALVLPGSPLSAAARRYELSLMEHISPGQSWGVSAGVPAGVTVALKNGWLPVKGPSDWAINSIGWIDGDRRDYLIAVLTNADPSEAYGIETAQTISALVYAGLAAP
jgi:beta-lactamase class A